MEDHLYPGLCMKLTSASLFHWKWETENKTKINSLPQFMEPEKKNLRALLFSL